MKYGCFHCGEINGETYQDELDHTVCRVCDTRSVVSFMVAMDLLREVDLDGNLPQYHQEIIDNDLCEEDS
jgi:hypothetical protein